LSGHDALLFPKTKMALWSVCAFCGRHDHRP
jgi:hypothetical protein